MVNKYRLTCVFIAESMPDIVYKYILVFTSAAFKVFVGVMTGYLSELSFTETVLFSTAGMMLTVFLLSFFGEKIKNLVQKRFFSRKKLFTKRNRLKVRIWRKYGMVGVAILTPPLFTPIGGTLLAVSFGEHKRRIIITMLLSAIFWAMAFGMFVYGFGELIGISSLKEIFFNVF